MPINAGLESLTIGCGDFGGGYSYAFNGSIDEIRIYDRVLCKTEIELLSNPAGGFDADHDGDIDAQDLAAFSEYFGLSKTSFYLDSDKDSYGDINSQPVIAWVPPEGYVSRNDDCDDMDPDVNPGAEDICDDGIDSDCNINTCNEEIDDDEDGYTENDGDCDDADPDIYPDAPEIACDGIDQNCDPSDGCRFKDMGDGTVMDMTTGLTWLKNAGCLGSMTLNEAVAAAAGLSDGECGLSDGSSEGSWRLPTYSELMSLFDYDYDGPCLSNAAGDGQWSNGDAFTSLVGGVFWSSDPYNCSDEWQCYLYIDLYGCEVSYTIAEQTNYVFPVKK